MRNPAFLLDKMSPFPHDDGRSGADLELPCRRTNSPLFYTYCHLGRIMLIKNLRIVLCASIVASWASAASAVLYSDNFNTAADSANWTINAAPTANASIQHADFGFDYSVDGTPPAPGSSDTLGMRLRANTPLDGSGNDQNTRPAGATSGLSVSPTGKNFGTNYQVTFYAWSNFAGAANASGLADNANSEGGTNNILFALGTSGTSPL